MSNKFDSQFGQVVFTEHVEHVSIDGILSKGFGVLAKLQTLQPLCHVELSFRGLDPRRDPGIWAVPVGCWKNAGTTFGAFHRAVVRHPRPLDGPPTGHARPLCRSAAAQNRRSIPSSRSRLKSIPRNRCPSVKMSVLLPPVGDRTGKDRTSVRNLSLTPINVEN